MLLIILIFFFTFDSRAINLSNWEIAKPIILNKATSKTMNFSKWAPTVRNYFEQPERPAVGKRYLDPSITGKIFKMIWSN
jgi:hypothetical protein